jgi:hypothetical protein
VALLLAGIGCFIGARWLFVQHQGAVARTGAIGLGAAGVVCLVLGTVLPLLLGARPTLTRPSTTARLMFVSPAPGPVLPGGGGPIHVVLKLDGGRVVPFTSLRLVPNEGHIHLSLDGSLVAMATGLDAEITVQPSPHRLVAEFVAVDHGPFDPRVLATVDFSVGS